MHLNILTSPCLYACMHASNKCKYCKYYKTPIQSNGSCCRLVDNLLIDFKFINCIVDIKVHTHAETHIHTHTCCCMQVHSFIQFHKHACILQLACIAGDQMTNATLSAFRLQIHMLLQQTQLTITTVIKFYNYNECKLQFTINSLEKFNKHALGCEHMCIYIYIVWMYGCMCRLVYMCTYMVWRIPFGFLVG